jgi:hypothetical protein
MPAGDVSRLRPAEQFVADYQYTRGDAGKTGLAKSPEGAKALEGEGKSNLMIFSGQSVQRGAMFAHGYSARRATDLELGALLWSLRLWQQEGGTIGGQGARGHGRLRCEFVAPDIDQAELCAAYVRYTDEVRDEAVAWLRDSWGK